MAASTRQGILDFVTAQTARTDNGKYRSIHAAYIAEKLSISRNLASQYLNHWSAEGEFIKIDSRPVCFLHKKSLEELEGIRFKQIQFNDREEFEAFLKAGSQSFQSLIGYDASLADCIEQMKIAAHYPPDGLSVILIGEKGTGKSLLCSIFFRYLHSANLIPTEAKLFRISFYADQKKNEEAVSRLFRVRDGIVRQDSCGVVVLEKFHRLERQLQNRIFDQLSQRGNDLRSGWRFLFTAEPADEEMLSIWQSRIAVSAGCPKLSQRTGEEKEFMIYRFFTREEALIGRPIRVSQKVFDQLIRYHFQNNIDGLQGEIKKICAKAYLYQRGAAELSIYAGYFSEELLTGLADDSELHETQWFYPAQREQLITGEEIFGLPEAVYEAMPDSLQGSGSGEYLLGEIIEFLQNYLNRYPYSDEDGYQSRHSVLSLCENLAGLVENRFQCVLPRRYIRLIADLVKKQISGSGEKGEHQQQAARLLEWLCGFLPEERQAAEYFCRLLESSLGIVPETVTKILMMAGIHYYNQQLSAGQVSAVIICHGRSTASSIADAANSLFGKHIFEALDMPMDTTVEQITGILRNYISRSCVLNRVLILVDMGSLETIYEGLRTLPDMMIGIINHVSTGMAVHIGNMILEGREIPEILAAAAETSLAGYRIIEQEKKKSAILFIGEKNTEIAVKLKELFWDSLPKEIQIRPLMWNHGEGDSLAVFAGKSECEILFTLGIGQYNIEHVPHLELGDVISLDSNHKVYERLCNFLSEQEIQALRRNLLKNFSLQNIMEQLTILNPVPLTNRIEVALELLQNHLEMTLKPNTMMGLFLHLSYLIERLVTKNPISEHEDLEQFITDQKRFIEISKKCFHKVEEQYHVEIPLSEIAYIYDFIKYNEPLD